MFFSTQKAMPPSINDSDFLSLRAIRKGQAHQSLFRSPFKHGPMEKMSQEFPLWCNGIRGILGALGCRLNPRPRHSGSRIRHCTSCYMGCQLWLESDHWPGDSICLGVPKKRKQKKNPTPKRVTHRRGNFSTLLSPRVDSKPSRFLWPSICSMSLSCTIFTRPRRKDSSHSWNFALCRYNPAFHTSPLFHILALTENQSEGSTDKGAQYQREGYLDFSAGMVPSKW